MWIPIPGCRGLDRRARPTVLESNVIGTDGLPEVAHDAGVRTVVFVPSNHTGEMCEVESAPAVHTPEYGPVDHTDRVRPDSFCDTRGASTGSGVYDGRVPDGRSRLFGSHRVGEYAARSVLAYAHGEGPPAVDTDGQRVIVRIFESEIGTDRARTHSYDGCEDLPADRQSVRATAGNGPQPSVSVPLLCSGPVLCDFFTGAFEVISHVLLLSVVGQLTETFL